MDSVCLERVIDSMMRIPPIMKRKLHQDFFKAALEAIGADLAPHHLMILRSLQESGTMHSSEIGEMMAIARPQMSHSVDKLVKLGMVERHPDTQDRRRIQLSLTPAGFQAMAKIDDVMSDLMKARLAIFSDEELEKLADSFQYIADTFSRLR